MKRQERKKEPENVRRRLLDAAGGIAAANGVSAITLDAVARAAGVSKGGLLHHFPGRQALVKALGARALEDWDKELRRLMEDDPVPEGRFTRAYLRSTVDGGEMFDHRVAVALTVATCTDETLRNQWNEWLGAHTATEGGDERTVRRHLVRAAVDGLWVAAFTGVNVADAPTRAAMVEKLMEMTF